jgi:D-alanyl-D-alanine carboxypeptidase
MLAFNVAAAGDAIAAGPPPAAPKNYVRQAALVIDADTGTVLIEQNSNKKVHPASLTKLMTLYLTFEAIKNGTLKLDQQITITRNMPESHLTVSLRLKKGQVITVEQAIEAVTVHSANDAAVVLAEAVGGSQKKFIAMMNAKARELKMTQTHFRNANGMPDPLQVTTALDTVTLSMAHLRDFPQYSKYFEEKTFTFNGRTYESTNRLMRQMPEIKFGKTGYVDASGYNMTVAADRDGDRLFAAVFGGKTAEKRDRRMEGLLNDGFEKAAKTRPPPKPPKPPAPAAAPTPPPPA